MVKFEQMDRAVTIFQQFEDKSTGPIVLMNVFHVASEDVEGLMAAWKSDSAYFKAQPGFISAQLHRGVAGSTTFFNYAVWESIDKFGAAFRNPIFQEKLREYPASATASPHIFRRLAIEDVCVA